MKISFRVTMFFRILWVPSSLSVAPLLFCWSECIGWRSNAFWTAVQGSSTLTIITKTWRHQWASRLACSRILFFRWSAKRLANCHKTSRSESRLWISAVTDSLNWQLNRLKFFKSPDCLPTSCCSSSSAYPSGNDSNTSHRGARGSRMPARCCSKWPSRQFA